MFWDPSSANLFGNCEEQILFQVPCASSVAGVILCVLYFGNGSVLVSCFPAKRMVLIPQSEDFLCITYKSKHFLQIVNYLTFMAEQDQKLPPPRKCSCFGKPTHTHLPSFQSTVLSDGQLAALFFFFRRASD